jgi:hypothetical protein
MSDCGPDCDCEDATKQRLKDKLKFIHNKIVFENYNCPILNSIKNIEFLKKRANLLLKNTK